MLDFAETHDAQFNRKSDFRDTADPLGPLGFWLSDMGRKREDPRDEVVRGLDWGYFRLHTFDR